MVEVGAFGLQWIEMILTLCLLVFQFVLGTIGNLGKGHVFVDVGHGIGNLPIQAAFTRGCESRGIEMVGDRHDIAMCLDEFYQNQHQLISDHEGKVGPFKGSLDTV